jgi:hypothetical protein
VGIVQVKVAVINELLADLAAEKLLLICELLEFIGTARFSTV